MTASAGLPLWPDWPPGACVFGPPGTGKTRAILDRILLPAAARGDRVLALAFTRAAAHEMTARLRAAGVDGSHVRCSTVHAEALRRLRRALGPDLPLALRQRGDDLPGSGGAAAEAARACRDLALATGRDLRGAWGLLQPGVPWQAVERLAARYEQAKGDRWDFTDILLRALTLDGTQCSGPQCEGLVVDEAQDLSPLQWRLAVTWWAGARVRVAVGDPDQSVYLWAGADAGRMDALVSGGFTRYDLTDSWRLPPGPLATASDLISRNRRPRGPWIARARAGGPCTGIARARAGAGGSAQARPPSVDVCWASEPVRPVRHALEAPGTIMLLARHGARLGQHAAALRDAGIPFATDRHPEIQGAAAYLALRDLGAAGVTTAARLRALIAAMPERFLLAGTRREDVLARLPRRGDVVSWPLHPGLAEAGAFGRAVLCRLPHPEYLHALDIAGLLEPPPRVALATWHASKGREADTAIVDLRGPRAALLALGGGGAEGAAWQERCALYVALTRCRRLLVLIGGGRQDLGTLLGLHVLGGAERETGAAAGPAPTLGLPPWQFF